MTLKELRSLSKEELIALWAHEVAMWDDSEGGGTRSSYTVEHVKRMKDFYRVVETENPGELKVEHDGSYPLYR